MAMENMTINTEILKRIGNYFEGLDTCEDCLFSEECWNRPEETCYESVLAILTSSNTEPKNYMVEARIDGFVHIPVTATSKEEAYKMAEAKAREMVEDYVSFEIDINSDSITEV